LLLFESRLFTVWQEIIGLNSKLLTRLFAHRTITVWKQCGTSEDYYCVKAMWNFRMLDAASLF
jgi:hypothetical protein